MWHASGTVKSKPTLDDNSVVLANKLLRHSKPVHERLYGLRGKSTPVRKTNVHGTRILSPGDPSWPENRSPEEQPRNRSRSKQSERAKVHTDRLESDIKERRQRQAERQVAHHEAVDASVGQTHLKEKNVELTLQKLKRKLSQVRVQPNCPTRILLAV